MLPGWSLAITDTAVKKLLKGAITSSLQYAHEIVRIQSGLASF